MRNLCGILAFLLLSGCGGVGREHKAPAEAVDLNNQAYHAFLNGDHNRALLLVNDAIKVDPQFAEAYSNKAAILEKQGKREKAAQALQTLVQLRPVYAEAYIPLGVLLEKLGRKEEANNCYTRAFSLYSDRAERATGEEKPGIEVNLAIAQYLLGDAPAAAETLKRVLAENPDFDRANEVKNRIQSGRRDYFLGGM